MLHSYTANCPWLILFNTLFFTLYGCVHTRTYTHASNVDSSIQKGSAPLQFPRMEWITLNLPLYMPHSYIEAVHIYM